MLSQLLESKKKSKAKTPSKKSKGQMEDRRELIFYAYRGGGTVQLQVIQASVRIGRQFGE